MCIKCKDILVVILVLISQLVGAQSFLERNKTQSCLLEEQRIVIKSLLKENKIKYQFNQRLTTGRPSFILPLRQSKNYQTSSFFGISNFVDLEEEFPDNIQDYNCGERSYDTSNGYNHQGTDYYPWPFSWRKMKNNQVEVIAAAAGTIILKQDGFNDKSCQFNQNQWNAIYIQHEDGSVAWYGHFKTNSLTTKEQGDTVEQGEFLGVVGSSGNSTGPHLHFEVYDKQDNLIDPYAGSCNTTTSESWWEVQEPYHSPQINLLMTHHSPPVFGCSSDEEPNIKLNFLPGEKVYFATYFRDQLAFSTSNHTVLKPDESVFQSWTTTRDRYFDGSYWFRSFDMPVTGDKGKWTFRVEYEGQVYNHYFYLGDKANGTIQTSVDTVYFDAIEFGQQSTSSFFIENSGNNGLWIENIATSSRVAADWDGVIHAGESKEIIVDILPASNQDFIGNLTITTNADPEEKKVVLIGRQAVRTKVLETQTQLEFGQLDLSDSVAKIVRIQNTGNDPLTINDVTYPSGIFGEKEFMIEPNGIKNLKVTAYSSVENEINDSIRFTSDATSGKKGIKVTAQFIDLVTGFDNKRTKKRPQIFPNPVKKGILNIKNALGATIRLLDINGKELVKLYMKHTDDTMEFRHFEKGLYIVEIAGREGVIRHKVLKE